MGIHDITYTLNMSSSKLGDDQMRDGVLEPNDEVKEKIQDIITSKNEDNVTWRIYHKAIKLCDLYFDEQSRMLIRSKNIGYISPKEGFLDGIYFNEKDYKLRSAVNRVFNACNIKVYKPKLDKIDGSYIGLLCTTQ